MSGRHVGRGCGTAIMCNRCGAKSVTGQIRKGDHRAYLETIGWGRGSDPGQDYRPAMPARTEIRTRLGVRYEVKLKATPEREGRPRTTSHDLCPECLKQDRAALVERKTKRQKQVAARDAARKARAAGAAA